MVSKLQTSPYRIKNVWRLKQEDTIAFRTRGRAVPLEGTLVINIVCYFGFAEYQFSSVAQWYMVDKKLSFKHVKFEMTIRHPDGDSS